MIALIPSFLDTPETLVFEAKFGPFKAGRLYLISEGKVFWNGREAYRFTLIAHGGVPFFRIRDTLISVVDLNLRSLFYKKLQHEGNYHNWGWIAYDQENGVAQYHTGERVGIPKGSLDPLALVYVARTLDFDAKEEYSFPYHVDFITETVRVRLVGREKVKTKFGWHDCWVVKPIMRSGKNVFGGKGGMRIWIDRKTRLPVKVEARMVFGKATGVLVDRQ